MSEFSQQWLALRESADARARRDSLAFSGTLFDRHGASRIVDLGCGTGANFRALASQLAPVQQWTCIDNDAQLLAAFAESLRTPARAGDGTDPILSAHGAGWRASLSLRCDDLARGIGRTELPPGGLVSASALLDLVSQDWIESLIARCTQAKAHALFALTYDGRIQCSPEDHFDAKLRARINEHQRRDKGFGPALGPAAASVAAALFASAGFHVVTAASDWQLDAGDAALQRALIDGWLDAAREIDDSPELERWRARRLDDIGVGRLTITVGHIDLLASPAF